MQRRLDKVADEASYAGITARQGINRARRRLTDLESALGDSNRQVADQGARIDGLQTALQDARRAAADRPFPVGVAAFAFLAGALAVTAGWFFGKKTARGAGYLPKKDEPVSITAAPSSRRKDRDALGA